MHKECCNGGAGQRLMTCHSRQHALIRIAIRIAQSLLSKSKVGVRGHPLHVHLLVEHGWGSDGPWGERGCGRGGRSY
jgi:hypothetical protein